MKIYTIAPGRLPDMDAYWRAANYLSAASWAIPSAVPSARCSTTPI